MGRGTALNIGKISENVLKRSILKTICNKRREVLTVPTVGGDCACLQFKENDKIVLSVNPSVADTPDAVVYAVNSAVNNVAVSGAEPIGILVCALLPVETEEADIKEMSGKLSECTGKLGIDILGGHTEITCAVKSPVYSITAVGKSGETLLAGKKAKAGNDVVISKWIGLEGTSLIAKIKENELLKKFPARMIYEAKNFDKLISVVPEAAPAIKSGVTAMHDVSKGGVFAALWEMAELAGVGLEIDLREIPVKQETIEICNYFDINPYELSSGGSCLFATEDGNKLVLELKKAGIESAVIGKCTSGNDRVLINGENRRFLEPAKDDEINKVL